MMNAKPEKGRPRGVGRMYPKGHVHPSWQGIGYWPPTPTLEGARYIFGQSPDGVGIASVKSGKMLLLSWDDLGRLAEAEGLNIQDAMPEGETVETRPGLPGDRGEEKASGTTGHAERRGALRSDGGSAGNADPGIGPDGGASPGNPTERIAGGDLYESPS